VAENLALMNHREFATFIHDCQLHTSSSMNANRARKIFNDVASLDGGIDDGSVDEKGNKEQQMVRASLSVMFLHLSIFCEFAQKRGLD
jgi:hypothetical protein